MSRYDIKFADRKFATEKDRTILKVSIDDCAKACNDELGFECLSFDFCFSNGDCRLSKSKLSNDASEYYSTGECDIYESKTIL